MSSATAPRPPTATTPLGGRGALTRAAWALGLVLAAIGAVRCDDADSTPDIDGKWLITEIVAGGERFRVLPGTAPFIAFADGRVSGDTTCNSLGGDYKLDGDRLSFDNVFTTLRVCLEPERMAQGARLLAAMEGALTVTVTGDQLRLARPGAEIVAVRARA